MQPFRSAASSSSNWKRASDALPGLLLYRRGARADPCCRPRIGVAASHQMHEFLWRLVVSAAAIAALLRHGTANPRPLCFLRI